jgi:protein-L-isoaspartate(D-aspartate) O-methyltransferase
MEPSISSDGQTDASVLHQALVDKLKGEGTIHSAHVEAAFRAIPRHVFLPGVALETVYSDTHVVTKEHERDAISSSSQPTIMALMLELLDLHPGERVLEIGAGTGYNAALMAHIVGEAGHVVTMDIDDDIVEQARALLVAAGHERVHVVCGDGGFGYPSAAPYDKIILTVGTADLAPAWWEQLKLGGRLVVPLGLTRLDVIRNSQLLIAFDRTDSYLESVVIRYCFFMALRGAFATARQGLVPLGPEPGLILVASAPVDVDAIYTAVMGPGHDDVTGVRETPRMLWGLRLWLALHEPLFCDLYAEGDLAQRGGVPLFGGRRGPYVQAFGLCEEATLCVVMYPPDQLPAPAQPVDPDKAMDLVVRTFGPNRTLTGRLVQQVIAWETAGRPFAWSPSWTVQGLQIRASPRDTAYMPSATEAIIDQRSMRLVFAWPRSQASEP